jgi:hypothetical protein
MSIQVLCPACNEVLEWHLPPVTACGRCGTPYPPAVRDSSETALKRSAARKPGALVLGQWLSTLGGGLWAFSLLLAPFNAGHFTINGETVSGPEFLRHAGFGMGLSTALLLAIAVGLWRDRAWSRPLMVLYWLSWPVMTVTFGGTDAATLLPTLLIAALLACLAAWYLYGSASARAYYDARTT